MKQLDVVMSPPAFLWDPHLTLTHVIFDLDICDNLYTSFCSSSLISANTCPVIDTMHVCLHGNRQAD